jgi:DNA polymerase-3 subunit gamma/tau
MSQSSSPGNQEPLGYVPPLYKQKAPASDDPLPLDPPLVPERPPLAAPVLALAAPEPLPLGDPEPPLMLVTPETLPLIVPVTPRPVWPDPLPLLNPDPPLPPEPASLPWSPLVADVVPHPTTVTAPATIASAVHALRPTIKSAPDSRYTGALALQTAPGGGGDQCRAGTLGPDRWRR